MAHDTFRACEIRAFRFEGTYAGSVLIRFPLTAFTAAFLIHSDRVFPSRSAAASIRDRSASVTRISIRPALRFPAGSFGLPVLATALTLPILRHGGRLDGPLGRVDRRGMQNRHVAPAATVGLVAPGVGLPR